MKRAILWAAMTFLLASNFTFAADKESYLKKAESEVQEWTVKLRSLQERSEKSGAKTRRELDRRVKIMEEKLIIARGKLDALRASNEGTWERFTKGIDEALREVKQAYRRTASYFKKSETKEKL